MTWFLVDKSKAAQPSSGGYRDWKEDLRKEGRSQCVYCAIREIHFGGFRNFHVEHYRPRRAFPKLTNDFKNLFYGCAICNSFKGGAWPGDALPDLSNSAFPDPSKIDYSQILRVDPETYVIYGANPAADYLIERLYLNRPQLILLRRYLSVRVFARRLCDRAGDLLERGQPAGASKLGALLARLASLSFQVDDISPYEPDDVRRPA